MNRYQGRSAVVQRIANLVLFAQARTYPVGLHVVAEELGVCERTARRYVEAVNDAGLPVRIQLLDRRSV